MNITNPIPMQFSSTYTLNLSSNPHTLFVLKIIISNPTVAQTITFYNQNGSVEGQPIVLTNSVEIKLRYVNFSKITFSDTNSYNIFASVQTLQFNTEENLSLYQSDSDFNIVPINNADIIKPLDTNGYVEVDDLLLNAKIAKTNQDANGNLGVNVIDALPSGSNALGTVGITALPSIPAGTNSIGTVGVTSLPSIPSGANSIGTVGVTALPSIPTGTNSIGLIAPNSLLNYSLTGTTNATASTKSQLASSIITVHHFQFVNTGTATIFLGDINNQAIPVAGGGVFLWDGSNETTDLSHWYSFSTSASVGYTVIYQ